jgi:phosphoribosylformylglycinamidine synthase
MFTAEITVMPLKELLDPQGKAVMGGLNNLGINTVNDVRIGKHIQLQIEALTKEEAGAIAGDAAKRLLANPVMEQFKVSIN